VSSRMPDVIELSPSAVELLSTAALGVGVVLHSEVVAFVLSSGEGISVVAKPGLELDLLRVLSEADWPSMVRMAEEMTA
jgi:hypothetical protein